MAAVDKICENNIITTIIKYIYIGRNIMFRIPSLTLNFLYIYIVKIKSIIYPYSKSIIYDQHVHEEENKLEEIKLDRWIEGLPQKLAGQIIFKEGMAIFAVQVTSIARSQEHLFLEITPCAAVGSLYRSTFKISGQIETLRKQPELYWYVPYVGWSLYLDHNVVREAVDMLSEIPAGTNYLDDVIIEEFHNGTKMITRRRPGPVQEKILYL